MARFVEATLLIKDYDSVDGDVALRQVNSSCYAREGGTGGANLNVAGRPLDRKDIEQITALQDIVRSLADAPGLGKEAEGDC